MVLSLTIPDPETLKNPPKVLSRPIPSDTTAQMGSGQDSPQVLTRPLRAPFPDEQDRDVSAQVMSRPIPKQEGGILQPVQDFVDYTKENFAAGKRAATDPAAPVSERLLGMVGMAASPAGGIGHAAISKPLERATGVPASQSDFGLMFTPAGVGAAAGLAGRAPGVPALMDALKDTSLARKGGEFIQAIISPTTINKEAGQAEAAIREQRGLAELSSEQAKTKLEPDYEYLSTLPAQRDPNAPEMIESAAKKIGSDIRTGSKHADISGNGQEGFVTNKGRFVSRAEAFKIAQQNKQFKAAPVKAGELHSEDIGRPAPVTTQREFINRIETFGKSSPLSDPRAEKAAMNLRSIYQTVRNDLETDANFDSMGFVQDYFPHLWSDPKKAQDFIAGWSKTGSARSTKKRSIPTIEDGIKAGLVPKSTNPAEITLQYIGNMYNYKALRGVQSTMSDQKIRKFFPRGKQPAGWVELNGPGNKNIISTKKGAFEQVAYAPESAARIYNRYYSPGFTGIIGEGVRGIRKMVNMTTALQLGLSAYHYRVLANESTAAALSRGIKGAKQSVPGVGMGAQYLKGERIERQAMTGQGGLDQKIIDYIARAGGRLKGVDKAMDMSAQGDYWRAIKNGSLRAAMKADALNLRAGGPIRTIEKLVGTVSQPLFMKTIPRIKNAVNYEAIADWIKAHPQADEEQILKASRDIVDSTDNRFGEMIQDNLFWDKRLKDTANILMLSVGWSLGTARETVGGAKDLADFIGGKSKDLSQRGRYVLAAPVAHALNAAVYQYLKTGQGPQDLQDLVYPRTGGVSPYHGMPEREMLPSQEKDVINVQRYGVSHELANKMAPIWQALYRIAVTGKDWRDDPIAYQYIQNAPGWFKGYVGKLVSVGLPISVKGATDKPMAGSNIGRGERFIFGSRPAGMAAEDPAGYAAFKRSEQMKAEKKGARHMRTDEQRRQ